MARPNEGKRVELTCASCATSFNSYLRSDYAVLYCSRKCYRIGCQNQDAEVVRRRAASNTGKTRTLEQKRNISLGQKGNVTVIERKRNRWLGELNPLWNGGMSKLHPYKHYRNAEYKNWREKVFERDNFRCQECGNRGGTLHPHHIKSYTIFPLLRYAVSNGLTLCIGCHHMLHGWRCQN